MNHVTRYVKKHYLYKGLSRRSNLIPLQEAFTLPEVLVSLVIITIALAGSIAGVNLILQSVRGTGIRADQNRRIDRDISQITRLSEEYNACVDPEGSVSTLCSGENIRTSDYYFPEIPDRFDPATWGDARLFEAACRAEDGSTHITDGFMVAIDALDDPGGDVTRENAERLDGIDPSNHLVQITWSSPARELRSIQVTPLVSAWCP